MIGEPRKIVYDDAPHVDWDAVEAWEEELISRDEENVVNEDEVFSWPPREAVTPPKFKTVEEADEWLEAHPPTKKVWSTPHIHSQGNTNPDGTWTTTSGVTYSAGTHTSSNIRITT